MKRILGFLCFIFSLASAQAQVVFGGYTISDYLVNAVHPGICSNIYVLGYPDDSIWVNFSNGQRMTGTFGSSWTDVPGNDVLLETGYHQSNYTVRMILSGGVYSAPYSVATTSGWTQMPDVPWFYTSASCNNGSVPNPRYILPIDFANFGLTPTDVVTGIEIVFLTTTGLPDLAGVYIIQVPPDCDTTSTYTDTTLCAGQTLLLNATVPNATYRWQDNSTGSTFLVSTPGIYWVEITDSCDVIIDSINVTALPAPSVNLGNDTILCTGQILTLDATAPNTTYLWQDNSTNATYNVTTAGTYWVQITNSCGSIADTIEVLYDAAPTANLRNDTSVCATGGFLLDATTPNVTYFWQDNSTNPTYLVTTSGTYWVQLTNSCGSDRDSIDILYASLPAADLGNDTTLCSGTTLTLNVSAPFSTYLWQDNSTNASYNVTTAGTYWVQVTNGCGSVSDTINIAASSSPTLDLGNDTTLCVWDTLTLDATAPHATYFWQNGATTPTLDATSPGTYFVRVINSCGAARDTIVVRYSLSPVADLGNDTAICAGGSITLNVLQVAATYLWQDQSTSPAFTVTTTGTYWVEVTNFCGSARDTINVSSAAPPTVGLGNDTTLCAGQNLMLDATMPNSTYLWHNNTTAPTFNVAIAGTYWVRVTNSCGNDIDTINVLYTPLPTVDLGNDTILCPGAGLTLSATLPNATYLWQDNSTNATFNVNAAGIYWVQVANSCGSITDSITIIDSAYVVNIGGDTVLCAGETLTLNATAPNATYLWHDNSTNATFNVSAAGTYWVQVTGCGNSADTVNVTYSSSPSIDLGSDTALCPGGSFTLDATTTDATYLWHDNSTEATFNVSTPGTYWVAVNSCGTVSDTITVELKNCDCDLFLPSAFSPNADSHNDNFKPLLTCNLTSYLLMIFNRWGEKVFESANAAVAWDGTYQGVTMPLGVYAYVVTYSFNNDDPKTQHGSITLIH